MPSRTVPITIPNMINGVSQQPASLRLISQSEAEVNTYASVVEGLIKRPPVEHRAKLKSGVLGNAFMHLINRDVNERYEVIITSGSIEVYDINGVAKTVNFKDRTQLLHDNVGLLGAKPQVLIILPSGVTTVTISSTITGTATVKWETSAIGDFTDAVTLATHTVTTSEAKTVTSGHTLRADITSLPSGFVTTQVTWKDASYLVAPDIEGDFSATTVADFTFIANKTVQPKVDVQKSATGPGGALYHIKNIANSVGYEIFINGSSSAAFTAPATGAVSTVTAIADLLADLNTSFPSGWTFESSGPAIWISKDDGTAFTAETRDNRGNTFSTMIRDTAQRFTDLPKSAKAGYKVRVEGDASSNFDDYYVEFVPNNDTLDFDEGVWKETNAGGINTDFLSATMPHTLVREEDGTFTFGAAVWGQRLVGDDTSNPFPSFIDKTINEVFFHKNRLCFLADTNVITSRASEFFEFFPSTMTAILDTDPIDVSASHTKVSILKSAVAFDEELLLFSDQTQFIFTGGDLLTANTAAINVVTEHEVEDSPAEPVGIGDRVFFPSPRDNFAGIRELLVNPNTDRKEAPEITDHVPKFLPKTIKRMTTATNENLLVVLSKTDPTNLYVYKFFIRGTSKLQSAWAKWSFDGGTILDIGFIETDLFLVVQRSDGVFLEKLSIQPDAVDADQGHLVESKRYLTHLDRRVSEADLAAPTYDAPTDKTTWVLPYQVPVANESDLVIVTRQHASAPSAGGVLLQGLKVDAVDRTKVRATGDHTLDKVFIGLNYEMRYTYSESVVRQNDGQGNNIAIVGGRVTDRIVDVQFADTGYFEVHVTHAHRPSPSIYKFFGDTLSGAGGEVVLATGHFKAPVLGKSDQVTVEIVNKTFLPCKLQSTERIVKLTTPLGRG